MRPAGAAGTRLRSDDDDVLGLMHVHEDDERSLREILDTLGEQIVRYRRADHRIVYCNRAWAARHDLAPADPIGRRIDDVLSAPELEGLRAQLELLSRDNPTVVDSQPRPGGGDSERLFAWIDCLIETSDGDDVLAVGRDVTEEQNALAELAASEARFRELADRSADVVFRFQLEPEPHFDYLSPAFERVTGHSIESIEHDYRVFLEIIDDEGRAMVSAAIAGEPMPEVFDLHFRRPDGTVVIGEMRVTLVRDGVLGVGRDVTEIRELQAKLAALALRDPLTGLANRRLLEEVFALALRRTDRSGNHLAVALLDLDGFKEINDTYGHDAGDRVLIETAQRLSKSVRDADVVARIGGDEFVVVHEAVSGEHGNRLVERLTETLSRPIDIGDGITVTCPASIGIVDTDAFGRDPVSLLAAADAAMYEVKRSRR